MALEISSPVQHGLRFDRSGPAFPPAGSFEFPPATGPQNGGDTSLDVVLRLSKEPAGQAHGARVSAKDQHDKQGRHDDAIPVLHFQVHENVLHYFREITSVTSVAAPGSANPLAGSGVLERLSRVLGAAGIRSDMLERSADNAMRLAIVASLFDVQDPAATVPECKRAASALPKWRLKRVLDHIDANISKPISLADLAGVAGMSRMYFASQFRAATGMRPHDYVLRKRIERAQTLLVTTCDSLVQIALDVGFQTQAHFTTVFKKLVGDTPNRWRRQQRRDA